MGRSVRLEVFTDLPLSTWCSNDFLSSPSGCQHLAIYCERIRVITDEGPEPKLGDLDEGEASILRAAIHHGVPCLVLIDERAGRTVAKEAGIAHTGTVGLILQAKKRGLVPSVRTLFEQLLAQDFRISAQLIRTALARAGED